MVMDRLQVVGKHLKEEKGLMNNNPKNETR